MSECVCVCVCVKQEMRERDKSISSLNKFLQWFLSENEAGKAPEFKPEIQHDLQEPDWPNYLRHHHQICIPGEDIFSNRVEYQTQEFWDMRSPLSPVARPASVRRDL